MIPKSIQSAVWSVDTAKLDIQKNKSFIIHQILAYGTWEQLQWLTRTYSKEEITDTFLHSPEKNYTQAAFHFVTDILLKINSSSVDQSRYVTAYPRAIG